jgi:SAM-dependent methyltransferase
MSVQISSPTAPGTLPYAGGPTERPDPRDWSLADRCRLFVKYLMWPGTNWVSRDKSRLVRHLLTGSPGRPVRTLDCGCGNAYFAAAAVQKGANCLGITLHDWERRNCEEMREYLDIPASRLSFRTERLDEFSSDRANHRQFDQVLLLDVIEHILDAHAALKQIHNLLDDNGFVYITTPNRDWQGNASRIRVTPIENGWHVRNGYTFEQLESVLDDCGFEPIERLRFGSAGSTLVTWIQHTFFRSAIDPMTVFTYPLLKFLALALSPWRDPHTIFVIARKRSD